MILVFCFITSLGCLNEQPPEDTRPALLSSHEQTYNHLRIIIKWPGDDFATKQDLETRYKIEQLILEKRVGEIFRSGTGMGWMDINVKVRDKDSARIVIEEIINEISPGSKFAIE